MSTEVHVVALLTPAPGKHDRLKELLTNLANNVQSSETGATKYQVFEQVNGEGINVLVVEETYKDQAAFDGHFKTPYFTALAKAIPEENLVAAPLDIKTIKPFAGFVSRI